jgi:AraC family transcriptional regulator
MDEFGDHAAGRGRRDADGSVTLLRTQGVWIRHQAQGPFRLQSAGLAPVLVFLFNGSHRASDHRPCPRGSFAVLPAGAPTLLQSADPLEALSIAYARPPETPHPWPSQGVDELPLTDAGVRALAHEIRRVLLSEGEASRAYLQNLADAMLVRALQVLGGRRPGRARPSLAPLNLRRVCEHIDSRLDERISVAELAAVAGLSRGHFSRAFQAATSETPHGFILSRRLEAVRRRLEEGHADLAHLAAQTGFSSHAHMTTAFTRAFGVTPRAYRKDHVAEFRRAS